MKQVLLITTFAALLGCSAAAQSADTLASAAPAATAPVERVDFSCDIRTERTPNGVVIRAVASSNRDFDGDYDLQITKSGANSADLSQSGAFTLTAGASAATLGESEVSLSRREHLHARLTLRSAGADLCHSDIQF